MAGVIERLPQSVALWVDAIEDGQAAMGGLALYAESFFGTFGERMTAGVDELMILPVSLRAAVAIMVGEADQFVIAWSAKLDTAVTYGQQAWLEMQRDVNALAGAIKLAIGGAIDDVLGYYADMVARVASLARATGADQLADELAQVGEELRGVATHEQEVQAELERTQAVYREEVAALRDRRAAIAENAQARQQASQQAIDAELAAYNAAKSASQAKRELAAADTAQGIAAEQASKATAKSAEELRAYDRDARRAAESQAKFADELLRMEAGLSGPVAAAQIEYRSELEQLDRQVLAHTISVTQYYRALELVEERYQRNIRAARAQEDVVGRLTAEYDQQVRLLGMTAEQRAVEVATLRAVGEAQEYLLTLSPELREAEEARIRSAVALGEAELRAAELAAEAMEGRRRIFENFAAGVGDAIETMLFDGARDGADEFMDVMEQLARDLVRFWLQQQIVVPLQQQLMGGVAGGGGANWLSALGSMFGSGGSAGNWLSTFGSMFGSGGTASNWLSTAGSMFGFGGTAAASFGPGAFAAYLGPGSTATYGVAATSTGVGTAAGTAGTGAMSASMAIPIIGWIIAAMMANDSLFQQGWRRRDGDVSLGGEVMGLMGAVSGLDSALQRLGLNERTASLLSGSSIHTALWGLRAPELRRMGAEGTYDFNGLAGRQFFDIHREGGLFRSDRNYTEYEPLDDAFDAAFADIAAGVRRNAEYVAAFMGESLDGLFATLSGAFRVELSRDPEEAAQQFNDFMVGMANGLAQSALDALGLLEGIDPDQGIEGYLARLQSIADLVTAVRNLPAIDLTGTSGAQGFRDLVSVLEEFALDGETLVATYQRVASAASMLDQATAAMGITLDATRQQVVEQAVALTEAAGGMERASGLWQTYLTRFFSPEEQVSQGVNAAHGRARTAFDAIGLNVDQFASESGMQALRELFTQNFASLSAAARVQWLEAAGALVDLLDAQAALTGVQQAQVEAARQARAELDQLLDGVRNGYQETRDQLDERGRSGLDLSVYRIERDTERAVRAAQALGASEAELAEIRQAGLAAVGLVRYEAADELAALLADLALDDALPGMTEVERQTARINQQFEGYIAQAIALGASEEQLAIIRGYQQNAIDRLTTATEDATNATDRFVSSLEQVVSAGGAAIALGDARREWESIIAEATAGVRGDGLTEQQRALQQLAERFDGYLRQVTEQYNVGRAGAVISGEAERFDAEYQARIAQLEALRIEAIANLEREWAERVVDERYRAEFDWLRRLQGFRDSLLLDGQLSTLTPAQLQAEATRQYDAAIAAIDAARATEGTEDDAAARDAYEGIARQFLTQSRDYFGSTQDYTDIFQRVLRDIEAFQAMLDVPAAVTAIGAMPASQPTTVPVLDVRPMTSELSALRSDLLQHTRAQLQAAERVEAATTRVAVAVERVVANTAPDRYRGPQTIRNF